MSYSVNGIDLSEACICLPRNGAWTADLRALTIDGAELTGTASIELDGLSLTGTVLRATHAAGGLHARIVGGGGALSKLVEPKQYVQTSFSLIVRDLLEAAGERLSPASSSELLETTEKCWVVPRQTLSEALSAIARRLEAAWRVESSGAVWLGTDAYPAVDMSRATLMEERPGDGWQLWGVQRPSLLPGVSINGRQVIQVQHHCTSDRLRTEVWFNT